VFSDQASIASWALFSLHRRKLYEYRNANGVKISVKMRSPEHYRRWEDKQNDLWTTWQRVQENMIKGGLSGRSASGKNTRTRAITGIDGDIRINKALWVIAEQFRKWKS
ncbi:DUF932 domain-containing protein, partial [Escherichia coli]|nr:DUF932 domain-containing protein [Escherichia coli]